MKTRCSIAATILMAFAQVCFAQTGTLHVRVTTSNPLPNRILVLRGTVIQFEGPIEEDSRPIIMTLRSAGVMRAEGTFEKQWKLGWDSRKEPSQNYRRFGRRRDNSIAVPIGRTEVEIVDKVQFSIAILPNDGNGLPIIQVEPTGAYQADTYEIRVDGITTGLVLNQSGKGTLDWSAIKPGEHSCFAVANVVGGGTLSTDSIRFTVQPKIVISLLEKNNTVDLSGVFIPTSISIHVTCEAGIKPKSMELFVDEHTVATPKNGSIGTLVFDPTKFKAGDHTMYVRVLAEDGKQYLSSDLKFHILGIAPGPATEPPPASQPTVKAVTSRPASDRGVQNDRSYQPYDFQDSIEREKRELQIQKEALQKAKADLEPRIADFQRRHFGSTSQYAAIRQRLQMEQMNISRWDEYLVTKNQSLESSLGLLQELYKPQTQAYALMQEVQNDLRATMLVQPTHPFAKWCASLQQFEATLDHDLASFDHADYVAEYKALMVSGSLSAGLQGLYPPIENHIQALLRAADKADKFTGPPGISNDESQIIRSGIQKIAQSYRTEADSNRVLLLALSAKSDNLFNAQIQQSNRTMEQSSADRVRGWDVISTVGQRLGVDDPLGKREGARQRKAVEDAKLHQGAFDSVDGVSLPHWYDASYWQNMALDPGTVMQTWGSDTASIKDNARSCARFASWRLTVMPLRDEIARNLSSILLRRQVLGWNASVPTEMIHNDEMFIKSLAVLSAKVQLLPPSNLESEAAGYAKQTVNEISASCMRATEACIQDIQFLKTVSQAGSVGRYLSRYPLSEFRSETESLRAMNEAISQLLESERTAALAANKAGVRNRIQIDAMQYIGLPSSDPLRGFSGRRKGG